MTTATLQHRLVQEKGMQLKDVRGKTEQELRQMLAPPPRKGFGATPQRSGTSQARPPLGAKQSGAQHPKQGSQTSIGKSDGKKSTGSPRPPAQAKPSTGAKQAGAQHPGQGPSTAAPPTKKGLGTVPQRPGTSSPGSPQPPAPAKPTAGAKQLGAQRPGQGPHAAPGKQTAPRPARSPAASGVGAVPPSPSTGRGAPSRPRQRPEQKPERLHSMVMEDLGDETLARISTPQRVAGDSLAPMPKKLAKASVDDSEIARRQKRNVYVDNANVGQDDDEEGGRKMFDKRELRKRHKDIFANQLAFWREQHLHEQPPVGQKSDRVQVFVRKRPLFAHETAVDEFDVISVRGSSEIVVHNCLTKADLRSLFVSHMGFRFSDAFGETSSDAQVYARCAAPAVQHVLQGGVASLFMFGQTGSGKTHTMSGLIKRAADQLFDGEKNSCSHRDADDSEGADFQAPLTLTAFEIAGRGMRDLLDTSCPSKELKIMEDKDHRTHVIGASSCGVYSAEDLRSRVENAQAHRATRATQVNDTSSRSHAVYRIWRGGSTDTRSVLTLVDCAGSERKEDTTKHDLQSRKDAAEINSTIFALKECFRVMRSPKGQSPPYRESILTRVLSDSFSSDKALIVAIGTVSPSATDTEHSIGTLRSLQQLQGTQMAFETREDIVLTKSTTPHPRTWSEDDVRQWMEIAVGGRAKVYAAAVKKGTDGKNFIRWPVQRFVQLCGGDDDLGGRVYADLRQRIKASGS
eukprot:CAMPEP_0172687600 /NCGR_PEP_ID=MMETSP1074-20121228/21796_1 /TAXON_ID=2916 /ORGANISM="Ceratium fusus, Strain PA161109" /LENGTH=742 /DNA_ID=CAMNT_0013507077 /DNA_START=109 /DNA_END=2337 /DNA_ORIENTATION=-